MSRWWKHFCIEGLEVGVDGQVLFGYSSEMFCSENVEVPFDPIERSKLVSTLLFNFHHLWVSLSRGNSSYICC